MQIYLKSLQDNASGGLSGCVCIWMSCGGWTAVAPRSGSCTSGRGTCPLLGSVTGTGIVINWVAEPGTAIWNTIKVILENQNKDDAFKCGLVTDLRSRRKTERGLEWRENCLREYWASVAGRCRPADPYTQRWEPRGRWPHSDQYSFVLEGLVELNGRAYF